MREWWLDAWVPQSGRVFVDVGANVGSWTAWLATNFERGYAIEPDPDAVAALRTKLPPNVTVHPVAAWSTETTLTFSRFADSAHTSAYFGEEGINTGPRAGLIELPCRPLDALEIVGPVDFLKCDTEGAEVEVLRGAELLIRRDRPWLLIEVHAVENCLALTRLLAEWGYLFTIVRYPGYDTFSHHWYAHCWFSCQPAERVDVSQARESRREIAGPPAPTPRPQ